MSKPTYHQERVGDYITTYMGHKFYVIDPRPQDVDIMDIAHALSQSTRFTGHTRYKFYSVGEHSILCALLAQQLGLSTRIQMIALLHDASEAYCADVNRPLKQYLTDYKTAEDKIMNAIWEKFDIQPTEEEYKVIKKLDNTLLITEMTQLMYRGADLPDVECFEGQEAFLDLHRVFTMEHIRDSFIEVFKKLHVIMEEEKSHG